MIDMVGKKFGKLTVTNFDRMKGHAYWMCRCSCGKNKSISGITLRDGRSRSCGCVNRPDITNKRYHHLVALKRTGNTVLYNGVHHTEWLCRCDCGNILPLPQWQLSGRGKKHCGCMRFYPGSNSKHWKGGRFKRKDGYICIYAPDSLAHKYSRGKYVLEHVHVMCIHLNRTLQPQETVHHKNGIKDDNRLENLELWNNSHPYGQRVEDKVEHAIAILKQYRPELIQEVQ